MGSANSTPSKEQVFLNETPIQFSPDVVEQLADRQASPETTPERQTTLDKHIQSKIHAELSKLQKQEEDVRQQIEAALEKENLDRERSLAGDQPAETGGIKSSAVLLGDLEQMQAKIGRFKTRISLQDHPQVKEHQQAVISCYKSHPKTTLECWKEVQQFKNSVALLEQDYFKSLQ